MAHTDIVDDLRSRGLFHDSTNETALRAVLADGPVTLYHGIDPTADSLHVGHLVGVLVLRRFQDQGHTPLALVGGATGMVGDPGGRSDERNLLDEATLSANVEGIRKQLEGLLDFADDLMVNNLTWTSEINVIDFLRDVGKHATVNQMIAKESVKARIEGEAGISFTEFSYMLLQANDFWWLHEHRGCLLQVGGSDQWGNITAGIDMIRRRSGVAAHGLTWPLITRSDGKKFGKSTEGNVWLSAERTSPYRFYQHWIQTSDDDVERYLLQLTLLDRDEIETIVADHQTNPAERRGQLRLAAELTSLIHGVSALSSAREASEVLFSKDASRPDIATLALLAEELPVSVLSRSLLDESPLASDLLALGGVTASKGEARRALKGNAISINGTRAAEPTTVGLEDLWYDRYLLVRSGKKHYLLVAEG
ncbi:MAG: tyrosine--tRNA ligase [Acidobacteria bacterium]|nr:tyrosine--tRNA ligase [Acidobacteriota bacterium]